jgi:peptidoglycan/LPS O-acetylase OafA/YrhL
MLRGRAPRISTWQRISLLALGFACWFFACYGLHAFFLRAGSTNPGSWPLMGGWALAVLGCILLMVAFLGVKATKLPGWAIYLGRISYGLYVFHVFAIFLTNRLIIQPAASLDNAIVNRLKGPIYLLNLGLALGLTILLAAISYRYFETPFLRLKKRHAVIESQPIEGSG